MSLAEIGQEWATAMDLVLWCLQGVAARRPSSMETVFKHRFFDSTGALRFLQSTEDSWDRFVRRQAAALHSAIDCKDSAAVKELFSFGGVHIDMLHGSIEGCEVRPLHRPAFTGKPEVLRDLIDEIPNTLPDRMKSKILDCRTELDYTPYMLACKCGHTEVAHMLLEKGCSDSSTNSSQRNGKQLADVFQREVELSCVHPWSRGDRQHLMATSLESFLDIAKAALNEHVCAGAKVWNSKQMVWKFCKEQMQALQTRIKQLVCGRGAHMSTHMRVMRTRDWMQACTNEQKGTAACTHTRTHLLTCKHAAMRTQVEKGSDIALHFTDISSCRLILNSMGIRASMVGQLGGGVSVCLRTVADFDWGNDWKFAMEIGKALWGSKWYESHEPHAHMHPCTHACIHACVHAHAQQV